MKVVKVIAKFMINKVETILTDIIIADIKWKEGLKINISLFFDTLSYIKSFLKFY